MSEEGNGALIILGCPEVPVQQALALYAADRLNEDEWDVLVAGNSAVLVLLKVSDPKKVYVKRMVELDRCIEELASGERHPGVCIVFAHNDAGISYATTIRYLFEGRLIVVVFGREAEELAEQLDIPCEKIVEKAIHNPGKLRRKLDEVLGWAA
ncbi:DUF1890 domain-containing protein [Methanocalculus sp.]|uniref:DUF1890 domain-containing protein n=1 Tax=Methanocalculus sp. TaxID=2004547 RepID=UPI00271DA1B2|nr:DUF1890 domain-containing protein [Methanocalculus sp.]MDO8840729.1 DUF1890 domain-containing protein [Methanocalculus sp.]